MSSKPRTSTRQQQAADQALIDGFQKQQATIPSSLLIAGAPVPTTTIVSTLQGRMATRAAKGAAWAAYQAAVQACRDLIEGSQALVSSARQAVEVMFAGQIEELADFGLQPRRAPAPPTPQQMAVRVARARATRAARHTLGPVQKSKITGANPKGEEPG
jgi:hypothetical protein